MFLSKFCKGARSLPRGPSWPSWWPVFGEKACRFLHPRDFGRVAFCFSIFAYFNNTQATRKQYETRKKHSLRRRKKQTLRTQHSRSLFCFCDSRKQCSWRSVRLCPQYRFLEQCVSVRRPGRTALCYCIVPCVAAPSAPGPGRHLPKDSTMVFICSRLVPLPRLREVPISPANARNFF